MRILHILHQYLPDHVGGVELYTQALAQIQQQAGHEVAIFCRRSGQGQHLEQEGLDEIPVYRTTSGLFTPAGRFRSTLGDRFLTDSLGRAIAETTPDLIHIHHLMGLPAKALAAARAAAPLVATLHDYWWVCANAQLITDYSDQVCTGPRAWLNCARCGLARAGAGVAWPLSPLLAPAFGWRAAALRRVMPLVAAWIAPTAFVADWHTTHGFPAERMHVVGHGIELPPETAPAQTGSKATHFAYIGGLARQKGVHVLLDAFNGLPPSARLTIAGDESAFPDYCADLRARAAHPGIRFAGRLDREAVWQTLAEIDVLVVPSLWYETASLVVQEAFATNTPVIAADHGALSERVRPGVDGLLIPPNNADALRQAMQQLMDDPALLARLREGIKPVQTIAGHVQEVDALYRRALAENAPTKSGPVKR